MVDAAQDWRAPGDMNSDVTFDVYILFALLAVISIG
jgi:hypothetical protein